MPIISFTQRALDALDRLYGFVGGVSRIDRFNMGPVNLVHDVSREAEAAMGFPANFAVSQDTGALNTRVYNSTTRAAILADLNIVNQLLSRGLELSDVDVWLNGIAGVVTAATAANFANAVAAVVLGQTVGGGVNYALEEWLTAGEDVVAGGAVQLRGTTVPPSRIGYPILLTDDESTALRTAVESGAGGNAVITINYLLWVCPKGTFPPRA